MSARHHQPDAQHTGTAARPRRLTLRARAMIILTVGSVPWLIGAALLAWAGAL